MQHLIRYLLNFLEQTIMRNWWMVRASGGSLIEDFKARGIVAIGFGLDQDLTILKSKEQWREKIRSMLAHKSSMSQAQVVGIVWRFVFEIAQSDHIITYDPSERKYLVGECVGGCEFHKSPIIGNLHYSRRIRWFTTVDRDALSVAARNSLGSMQTVFGLDDVIAAEFETLVRGEKLADEKSELQTNSAQLPSESSQIGILREEVVDQAHEFVKDMVVRLTWEQMQELIAGILRAMGDKTRVSAKGADRGRDIVASPDGLGLQQPRIVVEVKHREGSIGAPEIRSFVGGLRSADRGLYVSTGGYTKEARYEGDRATTPITLLDLDELVSLLVEHYDATDTTTKALVPLVAIYWPAS